LEEEIQNIIKSTKEKNKKSDSKLIIKAYEYAKNHHGNQKRESGELFMVHPVAVASILTELGLDDQAICVALLHDIIEDTDAKRDEILKEFGPEITEMIEGITKLKKLEYQTKEEQQVENYRRLFLAMAKDVRVVLIKLADRLNNMQTLKHLSRKSQIRISKETLDIYAPLANRLGIYSLKSELENLAFKYLYPEEYKELLEGIKGKKEERLKFLDVISDNIKSHLKEADIEFDIQSRVKHFYSIYRKMQRDNCGLESIYDLFAIRILVNSVKDCYAVLGIVHELYNPIPGKIKDYIAVPKSNNYQSLHTTLIGANGVPFEVQIRTWEMHQVAEFGVAAHWAFKEANKHKRVTVTVKEDKLAWVRETLKWQGETQDPEEFMKVLKTELFEDEVYVFTPKGDIKVLPRGSNTIDLAYSIHEEIGNKMTGAKVNNKMKPIITELKNGDIVEIITSDNSTGPSRDWLKFVKSSGAKTKIQKWFRKIEKEETKDKQDIKKSDVGANIIRPEIQKLSNVGSTAISTQGHSQNASTGIKVKGIDNCLVKFSKCCNPLPGDEIVGYITKGRGVSIHRSNCSNISGLISEEARLIDVYWEKDVDTSYNVDIEVLSSDRKGLLADIIKEIGNAKTVKLLGVNSKITKDQIAIIELKLEITNLKELKKMINILKSVQSVYEVNRRK